MKHWGMLCMAVVLAGCASRTPTYQTEAAYLIYDVQPATLSREHLMDSISNAVRKNVSKARITRDIPPAELPDKPGRFQLVEPFAKSNLGAMMAAQGQTMKVATCKDAMLTMAADSGMGQERTYFFICVMPYKAGYSVNIYATFSKQSGGMSTAALGAALAQSALGDSSQFIPRTIDDVRIAVEGMGAQVTVVDRYIPESFRGAFVNRPAGS